ncbi:MAG: hypothetical protein AAF293_00645 [Pseudomonadota bacterium]
MTAPHDPSWTAPPESNDWRDEDVLRFVEWLKGLVPAAEMQRRVDRVREAFEAAWRRRAAGETVELYNSRDTAAWYVFQAESYATDRRYWVPEECVRIAPSFARLGLELDKLRGIYGSEDRAARMMVADRGQPDGAIYELLVALAYKRRGWSRVEFVPEERGIRRTHDLNVFRRSSRWAVECKRTSLSSYARRERDLGRSLAAPVHQLCSAFDRSVIVEVLYHEELNLIPDGYLEERVATAIDGRTQGCWRDELSVGRARDIDWALAHNVLSRDYVYYGSSRMIELLVGEYRHNAEHSMAARWRPAPERPTYADAVYQASVVSWWSLSEEAEARKARHFRSVLANAEGQLPDDRPGCVHIGVESIGGHGVDARRHILNLLEAHFFGLKGSRLRWVYVNHFVPELTTAPDESWAVTETMAPYRVGSHNTRWPLPGHLLISPEDGAREGVHWDGLG